MFSIIGILGRYLLVLFQVQPFPNFEIITVLTFFAMLMIRPYLAFFVPLVSMVGSDLLIGNPILSGSQINNIVLFTYTGFLLLSIISISLREKSSSALSKIRLKSIGCTMGIGVGLTLIYDIWTNAGWWYLMYPHTIGSLVSVFIAGIPFMVYHMLSAALTFSLIGLPMYVLLQKKDMIRISNPFTTKQKLPLIAITVLFTILSLI
jgi:hypothetical protein